MRSCGNHEICYITNVPSFLKIDLFIVMVTLILLLRILESNTTLREGQGNPIRVSKICNPGLGKPCRGLQYLETRMGFPSPSVNVVIAYFSHSYLKICKVHVCLKCTLDVTFIECLALTFCDVISELLPEWAFLPSRVGQHFSWRQKL